MTRRWGPLITSALMLAAGATYVVSWASGPADCATVDVRSGSWTAGGVVVDPITECPLRSGDLVVAIDGRPLAGGSAAGDWAVGSTLDYTVVRGGQELNVPITLTAPDVLGVLALPGPPCCSSPRCSRWRHMSAHGGPGRPLTRC